MRELSFIERKAISGGYNLSVSLNSSTVMTGRGLPQALQLGLQSDLQPDLQPDIQQSRGLSATQPGFSRQLQRWFFTRH